MSFGIERFGGANGEMGVGVNGVIHAGADAKSGTNQGREFVFGVRGTHVTSSS